MKYLEHAAAFDRRGLEALEAIEQHQGFEHAARVLGISQPAVSQRLKELQKAWGDPLIVRTQPYSLTECGQVLVAHLRTVRDLESGLRAERGVGRSRPHLRLALSRDMLETWFLGVMQHMCTKDVRVTLVSADQEDTLHLLTRGEVAMALSPQKACAAACETQYVGEMDYVLAATPAFVSHYFPKRGVNKKRLLETPCLVYDQKDDLYWRYLKRFFALEQRPDVVHTVPSVQGFKQMILAGHALGLVPRVDVREALDAGTACQICPSHVWEMPLYLHTSSLLCVGEQALARQLADLAKAALA